MKILILFFGLLAYAGCQKDDETVRAEFESDAVWQNQLQFDGCDWHFSIPSGKIYLNYVPNAASLKKVEAATVPSKDTFGAYEVHLKYSPTGIKREVKCGWGYTASYEEVEVLEIRKK